MRSTSRSRPVRCSATWARTAPGSRPRSRLLLGLIRPTSGRRVDLRPRRRTRRAERSTDASRTCRAKRTCGRRSRARRRCGSSATSTARSTTRYRDELVDRFELAPDKKIRAYSHGNRQKVLLIAAFASRADLLLLDEPTTGLDPLMEQVFRACVREARDRGQTVLLSSHILSEVEAVCDRVAMLRAGRDHRDGQLDVLRGLAALRVHAELDDRGAGPLGRSTA